MGGKTTSTETAKIAHIQLQTSAYGGVLPIVFGTMRIAGNCTWYGNFTPIPTTTSTSSGGKGLGKVTSKNTTYTYTAAVQLGLCEGTIAGIGAVWKGKDKTTLAALGLTPFTGAIGQAPWSFRTGYNGIAINIARENAYGFAGQPVSFAASTVIGYSGTAYLAASAYDLGSNASVPNHGFEVQGLNIYGAGILDANPKDIVTSLLTSPQFGAGFPAALIGDLTSFDAYCRSAGLFFSPAYTEQHAAADHLKSLTEAANTALVWSDGVLKFVPYGDTALTGNGATFTPNATAVYDLTDDNFLSTGDDPVKVTRGAPADAFNRVRVEYLDRANQYNTAIVSVEDQGAIELYGLRVAPVVQAHFIADGAVATFVAQLALQRGLYKRNLYLFGLPASFALLEPMDIVTITTGDMTRVAVRITEINEDGDDFALTAEDFPLGVASAALYAHDAGLRYQAAFNTTPLSCAAPIIFEMPADPSATGLSVAIAVGGQTSDPLYGGCRVWLSLDGTNYRSEGIIYGSSRYGSTTAALAAAPTGSDVTNTLALALRSNGQMVSGSAADAAKGTTLIAIDGEYLAYQTAMLTGTNAYNLTTLNRGLYNTSGLAHASGVAWVRVDQSIAVLKDLDLTLIGQTIYIKVTAFNTFAAGEQDLSTVTAYTYTITGNMKALQTPVDFATRVGGAGKPELGATASDNMISNASLQNDATGWSLFGSAAYQGAVSGAPVPGYFAFLTGGGEAHANSNAQRPLGGAAMVYASAWSFRGAVTTGTQSLVIDWYKADGTVSLTPQTTLSLQASAAGVWQYFEYPVTVPPDAVLYIALIYSSVVGATCGAGGLRIAKTQASADVTAQTVPTISGPTSTGILCDYTGTPAAGQLPRDVLIKRAKGGVDVTATTAWAATFPASVTGTIGAANGDVNITALTGAGIVVVTATRDGVTLTWPLQVNKTNAAQPASGGSGASSASTSTILATNSASYATANAGPLTITIGASGTATLSAPLSFYSANAAPSGTGIGMFGKWQWRLSGGTFADVATEVAQSSTDGVTLDSGRYYADGTGAITINTSKAGLAAGSVCDFQLLLRTGGNQLTRNHYATGTASVSTS